MAQYEEKITLTEKQKQQLRTRQATEFAAMTTIHEEKMEQAEKDAAREEIIQDRIANAVEAVASSPVAAILVTDAVARKLLNDIDAKLAARPDMKELKLLAAQKMYITKQLGSGKKEDELHKSLKEEKMDRQVNKILNDETFQKMCDKLGPGQLMRMIQDGGMRLLTTYADAMQHPEKYEPDAPEAAPQAKNIQMQKDNPEQEGPVLKINPEDWPPK